MPPKIQLITDPKRAKILASETRLKILQEIVAEPKTISQLAKQLGVSPVAIFYHMKKLETAGFVKLVKTRVINNNLVEKFYGITTSAYIVGISTELPVKGPVPPKKQAIKPMLGISPDDIEKVLDLLGLRVAEENQKAVQNNVMKLLENTVQEASEVNRELLNQLNLKLSPRDRLKIENATMAIIPITLDRIFDKQENLETLHSVINMLKKKSNH